METLFGMVFEVNSRAHTQGMEAAVAMEAAARNADPRTTIRIRPCHNRSIRHSPHLTAPLITGLQGRCR